MEPDRKRDRLSADLGFNSIFPRLSDDLIFEILVRLPVKDLSRFKCVSKQWRIIITSQSFKSQHLQVSIQTKKGYRLITVTEDPDLSFNSCLIKSIYEHPWSVESMGLVGPVGSPMMGSTTSSSSDWIVGSCNGLICLRRGFDDVYLWNPCVREVRKLPSMCLMNGLYERLGGYAVYGFGYDKGSDDYKVVVIICAPNMWSYETQVMVWSMRTDVWRNVGQFPVCGPREMPGRLLNGALHWEVRSASIGAGFEKLLCIAAFDLETERFRVVPLPEDRSFVIGRLGVLGGWLCLVEKNEGVYRNLSLSVMKEYGVGRSWTTLFRMHLQSWPCNVTPLWSSEEGEILLLLDQDMVLVDPKKLTFRHPKINNFVGLAGTSVYVETFVSPLQN